MGAAFRVSRDRSRSARSTGRRSKHGPRTYQNCCSLQCVVPAKHLGEGTRTRCSESTDFSENRCARLVARSRSDLPRLLRVTSWDWELLCYDPRLLSPMNSPKILNVLSTCQKRDQTLLLQGTIGAPSLWFSRCVSIEGLARWCFRTGANPNVLVGEGSTIVKPSDPSNLTCFTTVGHSDRFLAHN